MVFSKILMAVLILTNVLTIIVFAQVFQKLYQESKTKDRNLKSAQQYEANGKMIKIECGYPRSSCIECLYYSECGGRGYILVVEDYVDIKIGNASICTRNPARLYLLNYAMPTLYLFIPSQNCFNDKIYATLGGVRQLVDLEDILCESLEHETIHYLLAKMFNMDISKKLDNIHGAMFEWIRK